MGVSSSGLLNKCLMLTSSAGNSNEMNQTQSRDIIEESGCLGMQPKTGW